MNEARFLEHYERIAEAPDAVARLRRFVLDLAVRGKLVPQDAGDEPASELLTRIAKEKARHRLTGGGRSSKPDGASNLTTPFDIPASWVWVTLGTVFLYDAGIKRDPKDLNQTHWLLELEDLEKDTGRLVARIKVSGRASQSTKSEFHEGDILYGKLRPYLNKVLVADEPGYSTTEIVAIRPIIPLCSAYCAMALRRPDFVAYVTRLGQGTKMPRLRTEDAVAAPFPLPPLAEQHRIVAKVDELMALCDRLEAARAEREARRDRLAAASLARLNAPDPDTFTEDARFALNALPALTTRPDQIKQLRQAILNLAVRGKLVAQDPTDEPIKFTLRRAMSRRATLVKAKKVRAKKLDGFEQLEADINLPSSWTLERLGNLVDPENTISYGVLVPGNEVPDGVPFVRAQDLALSGHSDRPNKTIDPEIEKAYARTRLRGGEILVCVVGSIGKLGIVPQSWAGANIARAVARILPIAEISREFLLIVLRGAPVQAYFTSTTRTLAQPTLNVGLIEQTPIPLPPLAEQHRIVAKVDELMALCDRLDACLATTATTRHALLAALLAEALAPLETSEREIAA